MKFQSHNSAFNPFRKALTQLETLFVGLSTATWSPLMLGAPSYASTKVIIVCWTARGSYWSKNPYFFFLSVRLILSYWSDINVMNFSLAKITRSGRGVVWHVSGLLTEELELLAFNIHAHCPAHFTGSCGFALLTIRDSPCRSHFCEKKWYIWKGQSVAAVISDTTSYAKYVAIKCAIQAPRLALQLNRLHQKVSSSLKKSYWRE